MNDSYSRWYNEFCEMMGSFDGDEIFDSLHSLILSGQNVFSLNNKVMEKAVDISWVEAIENGLIHLDNVIRSPRMTIEDVESIVPIALSRKITVESVKHLAQHTNLIQDYDAKTGKVTPSKVLNVYKEESMMTYENKFVNTLVDKLYVFINRRYDKLKEVRNDEAVSTLEYTSQVGDSGSKMNISLKLEAIDSLETVDDSGATTWDRIEKIKSTIESYKGSHFCMKMGSAYIRPPVMRTNAIMKNVDLKACLTLWQFIESYDKVGYELTVSDTAEKPDESYMQDMYNIVALGFMLMRFHSDRDNSTKELKTKKNRPVSPRIIRKFDKTGQDDYDMPVGVNSEEKEPNEYSTSNLLPEDAGEILAEFDKIIELEESYMEEEERKRIEAERIEEEKLRRRQEEERIRQEKERLAAIQAEKERMEREQREREEKQRQLQEMLEQQKREQEERERQEREEAEKRERERLEKEQREAEAAAKEAAEELEKIRAAAAELSEREKERLAKEEEEHRKRREAEKAERLEREKADAERAIRLRKERELIEQKPFEQIYLEYSRDAGAVIRRSCIKLKTKMGLVKEKPLSEVELGIREIEERCQKFYEEEQAQLRKQRSEKRALENKYDSYSNNIIRRMRIHVRNIAEKWDNRGKR
ncbi:MAG: DUF2357 domain-containing protein [Oscillospiraceae bacterium]|nr:DUF2357 domain-containing protein [Oscillospiraceae bacterium]